MFLEHRMFNTESGKKVQNALDEFRKKDTNVLVLKGLELKYTNTVLIKSLLNAQNKRLDSWELFHFVKH